METLPLIDSKELEKALQQEAKEAKTRTAKEKKENLAAFLTKIPSLPDYKPLYCPTRQSVTALPSITRIWTLTAIFKLFFLESYFELIAVNINKYASLNQSELTKYLRPWYDTSAAEIKVFISIILYIGLYRLPSVEVYWQTNGLISLYPTITSTIFRVRY